ncbi:hypothetical protein B0H13DRAFT_2512744 [Mycena leptocephala]|nr:hypothetical protein B0H13DRAFT_2512744 [Mycena leptocephala]
MTTIDDDNQTAPSCAAANQINRDELAGAKLWAVYISEAEKYDKALLEGWKSDMQGLLIFAGLFSASLTAFIVESYKTLSSDNSAITVALLVQISQQLNPGSNASPVNVAPASFTPSRASLACNTLWFLSLGLSLSCALVATLVDQWARDFIQRTEMRPSPVIRARIFSYLYFGLQRFDMHTMVEFIPLLLHMSLLLFFAGLVAFLLPINMALAIVVAALLGLISITYLSLTALPMLFSDSPYRTPLSNVAWGLLQRVASPFRARFRTDEESKFADDGSSGSAKSIPNIVERMVHDAFAESSKRDERDRRAIAWTIRSLTDNNDLEPLVDALPDLIRGPTGRRRVYDHMFNRLINDHNGLLVPRIEGYLRSCVEDDFVSRRCTSCVRALWSIAYFLASNGSILRSYNIFDPMILDLLRNHGHPQLIDTYSTVSLIEWLSFSSLSALVEDAISALGTTPSNHDHRTVLIPIQREASTRGYIELGDILIKLVALDPGDTLSWIQQCRDALNSSIDDIAYDTLIGYMQSSAKAHDMPYEFEATWQALQPSQSAIGPVVRTKLTEILEDICTEDRIRRLPANTVHHFDIIVDMILYLLQTGQESFDVEIRIAVVFYLITSGIGSSGDANFLILVDFLEHLYSSATSDGWKSIRAIDTFRFLLGHCPREPVPRLLQHRFATWFFNTIDGPFIDSHRRMVIAVIDWLYDSFSSEQFDDMDARRRIGEALTKFSTTLSPDRDQGLPPPEPIVLHDQGHAWYPRSNSVTSFFSDSETSGQSRRIATTPDSVCLRAPGVRGQWIIIG